jgi:phosphoglycolate phosphatase-like HAD superfamily hydrolase|tara:strand:- start:22 stop:900 length:879 start_codon:yes stop_codon:yes gene_type:complete
MSDPAQVLHNFQPTKEFFIGIDSDGCVFDSMEIKHQECFAPMFIKHFGLQAVSKYAREVWTFVNLYSKTRGCNRFHAVLRALDIMRKRKEVRARGVKVPYFPALVEWVQRETKLGNATLNAEVASNNKGLLPIKAWSDAVNATVKDIAHGVPPFPLVSETLAKSQTQANCIVISQTPTEALEREWAENDIVKFVEIIAGQEMGTKTEHLEFVAKGKFRTNKILMIGDAPGDQSAATDNGALFFPINPGKEEVSWERLHNEGMDRFFAGTFAGDYQRQLLDEFEGCLPENPSW